MSRRNKFSQGRKPKILHVITGPEAGGAERVALSIIERSHEFESFVVYLGTRKGPLRANFSAAGAAEFVCRIKAKRAVRFVRGVLGYLLRTTFGQRMRTLLKSIRPDLIHCHVLSGVNDILTISEELNIPVVWTLHNVYGEMGITHWWLDDSLSVRRDAIAVVGVAGAVLDDLRKRNDGCRYLVIYNGVDLARFRPDSRARIQFRTTHHIPLDAVVFAGAGRLAEVKRWDLFIDAASKIPARQAYFLLAGEGRQKRRLESLARQKGLSDRFVLLGSVKDMNGFWNAADVAMLTSDREGMPLVLLEAFACGKPCVCTAVGGIPEIVDESYGYLARRGDVGSIVRGMELLINVDLRREWGARAAKKVRRFSVEEMVRRYGDLYRECLGNTATKDGVEAERRIGCF